MNLILTNKDNHASAIGLKYKKDKYTGRIPFD